MAQKLTESFEAFAPYMEKYKELAGGGRLYKVKAINVTMTGNNRLYKADELLRSGRSLTDRGININHEKWLPFDAMNHEIDNRTLDAEYNEREQCVEAIVRIVDPWVNELYDQGKIKHVSIEGHARAADEVDGIAPLGVIFTGLAFVTDEKTPGDPNTSVQMVETKTFALKEMVDVTSVPFDTKSDAMKGIEDFKKAVESAIIVDLTVERLRKIENHGGANEMNKMEEPVSVTDEVLEDDILEIIDSVPESGFEAPSIDEVKKWIQKIGLKKGALHRQLGVPTDQKIPLSKLQTAAKSKGTLGARARLALRFRKFRHCMDTVTPAEILDEVRGALIDPIEDVGSELETIKRHSIANDERIREQLTKLGSAIVKENTVLRKDVDEMKEQIKQMSSDKILKTDMDALQERLKTAFGKDFADTRTVMADTVGRMKGMFEDVIKIKDEQAIKDKEIREAQLAEIVKMKNEQVAAQNSRLDAMDAKLEETTNESKARVEEVHQAFERKHAEVVDMMKASDKRSENVQEKIMEVLKHVESTDSTLADRRALANAIPFKGQAPDGETPAASTDDGEGFLRAARIKRRR